MELAFSGAGTRLRQEAEDIAVRDGFVKFALV